MRLFILRHGEAEDDIRNSYGGIADDTLTEKGQEQAQTTAKQIINENIQIILTSPLLRAKETADIISREIGGVKVVVIENLKERNSYGVLTGVNKDLAKKIFANILNNLKEKPGYSREPVLGSEDFDLFLQRVFQTFKEVINYVKENQLETVAIVSHGTFTRALFEHVLSVGDIKLEPTEVILVNYKPAEVEINML